MFKMMLFMAMLAVSFSHGQMWNQIENPGLTDLPKAKRRFNLSQKKSPTFDSTNLEPNFNINSNLPKPAEQERVVKKGQDGNGGDPRVPEFLSGAKNACM